jgi:S1-C subfamily serine protease
VLYYYGKGITQNFKQAYVWESLAAAQGHESAIKNRDNTAQELSPQQLAEAQDLAAQIQKKIDNPTESQKQLPPETKKPKTSQKQPPPKIKSGGNAIGSGTGFFITRDGYILTCHHVIKDAAKIEIAAEGKTYPATLVRDDPNNDLALLKINGSFPAIAFSSDRSAKMGQEVFTIGYPNPRLQGVSAKFTEGTINSLTGFQDDIRLYQISIPVQPGNSGGALLDENGNILGVVVAMLDAKTTFKITGSLPQNVNYAVKSIYAQALLDTLPEVVGKLSSPAKTKSDAIANAEKSTVIVICYD